jgi:hypothetical protein
MQQKRHMAQSRAIEKAERSPRSYLLSSIETHTSAGLNHLPGHAQILERRDAAHHTNPCRLTTLCMCCDCNRRVLTYPKPDGSHIRRSC